MTRAGRHMTVKRSGIAVSNEMLRAAQESYVEHRHPSYGLTDADMRRAIKAALDHLNCGCNRCLNRMGDDE